ncbi:MAG: pyridoxamine 5'-phosphate oxidase [Gemmatimonadetes bacterium]|nr:pyridoxamine 5'-phosphate oxidase [Gemmatimonadota bacterium]
MDLTTLRRDYALATLDVADVDPDPLVQFRLWFAEAQRAELVEPNAMTLATAAADGTPSARIVLLKEVHPRGFTFFTDYRSHKAQDLEANPRAALVFLWKELERQVRIAGTVERTDEAESTAYYEARPLGSRVGAWASVQSSVLPDRDELDRRVAEATARFAGGDPPRPDHWGGYRVIPHAVEFWQGRPSRLHDRVRYEKSSEGWLRTRLSP